MDISLFLFMFGERGLLPIIIILCELEFLCKLIYLSSIMKRDNHKRRSGWVHTQTVVQKWKVRVSYCLTGDDKTHALKELTTDIATKARTKMAREAFEMVMEFNDDFKEDIGLFSPLMLNVIELEPGEAMFLHAATPHAYVQGSGLEIMANFDNVLRAGLTPKHMDIDELISHTEFHSIPSDEIRLNPIKKDHKQNYPIPVDDFGFEIMDVLGAIETQFVRGAEILFCVEGEVTIENEQSTVTIKAGQSVFVCYHSDYYRYSGQGRIARAYN
ncbi:mannose-6-phosphate isomerase, class I [Aliivibrio fischeri]|nr:mannose-6-phosphate isomerase, class I [Aliivibrio fischeri]